MSQEQHHHTHDTSHQHVHQDGHSDTHHHSHHHHHHHHHRRRKKKYTAFIVVSCILAALLLAAGGLLWYTAGTYHYVNLKNEDLGAVDVFSYHQEEKQPSEPLAPSEETKPSDTASEPVQEQETTLSLADERTLYEQYSAVSNTLLVGTDSSVQGEDAETAPLDSIALISTNADTQLTKAAGISVDCIVTDDNGQLRTLKDIYDTEGIVPLIRAVNQNFKLDVSNFISIDFAALGPLFDILGGIGMSLSYDEAITMGGDKIAGMNDFDMDDMLAYINLPLTDEFHSKEYRQQNVLNFIVKKGKAAELTQYPEIIRKFLDCMETSLTIGEARPLIQSVQSMSEKAAWIFISAEDKETANTGNKETINIKDNTASHETILAEQTKTLHDFLYD